MKCPHCNQEINDDSQFCVFCGKSLNDTPAAEPQAENGVQEDTSCEETDGQATAEPAADADKQNEEVKTEETPAEETAAPAETAEAQQAVPAETAQAGAAPAPEGGEPKSKKKWILPVAILAVIAIAAGVFAMTSQKNPKDVVIGAFKSIVAEGQTNPAEEIFGLTAMGEKLNKESSEVNMEMTVEGSSDETLNQLVSGKIGFTTLNDVENNKMFVAMGLGYADMNLANLEIYLDQKEMIMAIPELSSKAFSLNYADDLEGQVANSPYVGPILSEAGMDLTGLNNYLAKCTELASGDTELFNIQELWKRYKEGSKAIDDLKAAMTVEKADKKSFTIDGKEVNCDGYHTTITKDALVQFVTTTKDFFLNDETLKNDFIEYMNLMNELQGTMVMMSNPYAQTGEEMQQQLWTEAETQLDAVIAQLKESMGDLTMDVYVRKDGKMAGFTYETTAVIEDENVKLYGDVSFGGGYSMMSNVNAVLNIESDDGEVVTISADKTGTYEKDKVWAGTLKGTMGNGTESYGFVYTGDYNAETKDYNISLDFLSGEDSQITITSTGMFTDLVKGESFNLEMSSLKLESPMITGTNEYIELSGKYTAGPLEQTVEAPAGDKFDILAATEDDYNNVSTEIMGNAFSLMMKFYQ
ncbi:zinc ribbon domain-containing protein [uncultured Clostridium sp.]|uniref:zinc ribbon domain-containing protein n=1 Tax=uncultured Clostridium sp. TaxID=59620 RepID=UPI0025F43102|nr:zinc-ribbon domain-containing protein [uncultured Clostridium sp.]